MKLNTYVNIKQPSSVGYIPVENWLNKIQQSEFSSTITDARNGKVNYKITKSQLPTVTWNFIYADYKKDDNCLYSTDFLFIDIDSPDFNINGLDNSKIYSYYKSFGGEGYGIIVKTKGITYENFKFSYLSICRDLGIEKYVDTNAVKQSQFSVLSYDPDIFINGNSYVFDFSLSIEELNTSIIEYRNSLLNQNVSISIVYKKEERTYTTDMDTFSVKYTNKHDILSSSDENYIVDWNTGYDIIECIIPIKKLADKRKRTLLSYITNLIFLNPKLHSGKAIKIAMNVNCLMCITPLPDSKVVEIVKSVLKQKENGRLIPIYTKRKIVFNKNSGLDRKGKLQICTHENAKRKTNQSKDRLYSIIEGWDFKLYGKLSVRNVAKNSPMNFKTISKYWSEFKDYITELNLNFKKLS